MKLYMYVLNEILEILWTHYEINLFLYCKNI